MVMEGNGIKGWMVILRKFEFQRKTGKMKMWRKWTYRKKTGKMKLRRKRSWQDLKKKSFVRPRYKFAVKKHVIYITDAKTLASAGS